MSASMNAKPDVAMTRSTGAGLAAHPRAGAATLAALAVIGLAMLVQLYLALTRQVNWDEFFFLSHVYAFEAGTLHGALQTFHVHLFGWLTRVPGTEADQIVVARIVMFALEIGTLGCAYGLARRFVAREAAMLAVLAYASVGFVIIHGTAFRADPIATFLLMAGLALLSARDLSPLKASLAGFAVALAGLVTIKSVFFVPGFVALALWQLGPAGARRKRMAALAVGALVSVIGFAGLFLLHRASLAAMPAAGQTASALGSMTRKVFGPEDVLARWPYLVIAVRANPLAALLFGAGAVAALSGAVRERGNRGGYVVAVCLAVPALTLFVYRNSFPYYYVFALAPAIVPAALAVERYAGPLVRLVAVPLLGIAMGLAAWQAAAVGQDSERETLAAIHEMFPDSVAYIDRCAMVASFPKAGFFMSTWGIENYRAAGRPLLSEAIASSAPPLVVANSPVLRAALMPGTEDVPDGYKLFPADAEALRDNYIHHWGPVWVAGKTLTGLTSAMRPFAIRIPGDYTLEADGPVRIDGVTRSPGDVLRLDTWPHAVSAVHGTTEATLRWGEHIHMPEGPAPDGPVFRGF